MSALDRIDDIKPSVCRDMAMNYSMDRVALMYHAYFERLLHQIHHQSFWHLPSAQSDLRHRRRDLTVGDVELAREAFAPRTLEGGEYHPGGSVKGGDPWLNEPGVWEWCLTMLGIESVLDIGAGEGHAAKYFSDHKCSVVAIDNDQSAINNAVYPVVPHDMRKGAFYSTPVDLVYMAEFVEHLPEQSLENLAITLARTDLVLMTFAPPGHEGIGHINCQDEAYWVEWMAQCGFRLCDEETKHIREIAEHRHFSERALLFKESL